MQSRTKKQLIKKNIRIMKFSKSIVTLALSTMCFVACNKNTASKPADDSAEGTTKKEVAAAVKPETASFKIDGMVCLLMDVPKQSRKNYLKWMVFKTPK